MIKTFEINGRTFAVVSYISDDNCYRLVYLPKRDMHPNDSGAINLIDDTACEDYYGDIDTVAEIMADRIRVDAEMQYPWWTLIGAIYQWGSEPILIEDEESARSFANVLDSATRMGDIDMNDEYESQINKEMLNLEDNDVLAIHTFVNGSYGTFSLADEWS